MRFRTTVRRSGRVVIAAAICCGVVWVGGCASPPSVEPLLRSAENVMRDESRLLDDDAARHRLWFEQQRSSLAAAYVADLDTRDTYDRDWIRDGADAYVLAREAILRHELELRRQNETRRRNLRLGGVAIDHALSLLQQQDRLFEDIPDVRRWLNERAAEASDATTGGER